MSRFSVWSLHVFPLGFLQFSTHSIRSTGFSILSIALSLSLSLLFNCELFLTLYSFTYVRNLPLALLFPVSL